MNSKRVNSTPRQVTHALRQVAAASCISLLAGSAFAQAAPMLANGNFEAQSMADGTIIWRSPAGWTGASGYYNPSSRFYALIGARDAIGAMAGANVAFLWERGAAPLQQTTGVSVEAGRAYTLTVALGGRSTGDTFAGAGLDLMVNGQVVATREVEAPPSPGSFGDVSLTWQATAASAGAPLTIRIRALNPGSRSYVDIDNVRLLAGLANADFEAAALGDGVAVPSSPTGWVGGSGTYNPNAQAYAALSGHDVIGTMSGRHVAYLGGPAAAPLEQTTPTVIAAGTGYTVRASLGGRSSSSVFPGVAIELLADGVVVASKAIDQPPVPGGFADAALSWQASASQAGKRLGVRFRALRSIADGHVDIDNVRLSAATGADWVVGLDHAGFEAPALASGAVRYGLSPAGWAGGTGSYRPDATWYQSLASSPNPGTMQGPQVGFLWGTNPKPLSQSTASKVVPGATYTLTAASGQRTKPHVYAGMRLELTANGTPVAAADQSAAPAAGSFGDVSLHWTAPDALAGAQLGVRVSALTSGPTHYVDVDNVRLTAVGPANEVNSPVARQVIQRQGRLTPVPVSGRFTGADQVQARLVVREGYAGSSTAWAAMTVDAQGRFSGTVPGVIGGWYDLEVRALNGGLDLAAQKVLRVGVGEVFVIAGQSNSANWGDIRQTPGDDRVSAPARGYASWQFAADPQPHADNNRGSPWPAFGTKFTAETGLPVGVVAVGVGGTMLAQWQPNASLYPRLRAAIQALGPHGFRAVLWHQGETDANRCTPADRYATLLTHIITATRSDAGWPVPWGVARASHLLSNQAACMQAVDAAQAQVVRDTPNVFAGPNTNSYYADGLTWDRIHFNTVGLTRHGQAWVDALSQWGGVPQR